MAKTSFTYACGCAGETQQRNRREADRRAEWLSHQQCPECRRKAENEAAAAANAAAGLPALAGTPKQVAWAESIRARILAVYDETAARLRGQLDFLSPAAAGEIGDALALLRAEMAARTHARDWIDATDPVSDTCALLEVIRRRDLAPTAIAEARARVEALRARHGAAEA